jgi:hypothetical protein
MGLDTYRFAQDKRGKEGITARGTLAKFHLHTDTELFEKAYGYIKNYF